MYAKIIIDITHEKLDRTFEYEVPKDMEDGLAIGSSVLVPFGNQDRLRQGFVVGFAKECSFDPEKIKAIHGKAPKSVSIEAVSYTHLKYPRCSGVCPPWPGR